MARLRIAWGVHGYGRGHATRVQALAPALLEANEVRFFASGEAATGPLAARRPRRLPGLAFAYQDGRLSPAATLARNGGAILDLLARGPVSRRVERALDHFAPDLVLSDSEPFVLRAARRLGLPTLSLDHVGIIAHCRPAVPPAERLALALHRAAYRLLLGRPDAAIVSSFFEAAPARPGVHLVPPILRDRVLQASPSEGGHLLAYFNNPALVTPGLVRALDQAGVPVRLYGTNLVGRAGAIQFRPCDGPGFVEDLATSLAVVATAGHQLISEAIHLGKPLLLCPEETAEQRLNAREAERLGVALRASARTLDADGVRAFLSRLGGLRAAMEGLARPGNARALEVFRAVAAALASRPAAAACDLPSNAPRRAGRSSDGTRVRVA